MQRAAGEDITAIAGTHAPRRRHGLRVFAIAAIVSAAGILLCDQWRFQAQDEAALKVVSELGGKTGSLMGWPFGKEYQIVFTRRLSDSELQQLAEIKAPRVSLGVMFRCELTEAELRHVRDTLTNFRVVFHHPPSGV